MHDDVANPATFAFLPARRDLHLYSGFLQDQITLLRDRLFLTLGSKFEHNSFSGFEFQPTRGSLGTRRQIRQSGPRCRARCARQAGSIQKRSFRRRRRS
jgi:hypothetical protein